MELTVEQQYMEALTLKDKELFKKFLAALEDWNSNKIQSYYEKLAQLVVRQPYPTLQILNSNCARSRFHISKIIVNALLKLLLPCEENGGDGISLQVVNFIANFPLIILEAASVHTKLRNALMTPPLNDKVFLALLSRSDDKLLKDLMEHLKRQWRKCDTGMPSKEFVLFQALNNKLHFIPLISVQLNNSQTNITDIAVRNNLLILKLANELSNTTQSVAEVNDIDKWLESLAVADSPSELKEIHKFFYADFKRISDVIKFLKRYPDKCKAIPVKALLNKNGILKLIYDYEVKSSFEDTRHLIVSIYKWQQQILTTNYVHDLEMETLNYYAALSTVYDVILANNGNANIEQYYTSKMQQLNAMLRQMQNFDILCSLIEDIFQMVFLRWEHNTMNATADTTMRTPTPAPTPSLLAPTPLNVIGMRHGFICRGPALHTLFTFLKNFVTKKLHSEDYKLASERIQLRFQRIVDIISETLWKYSVLEKIDDSLVQTAAAFAAGGGVRQQYTLDTEELLQLVHMHKEFMEKSSSDDESHDHCNYRSLTRRKAAKKRRRATFSGVAPVQMSTATLDQTRAHSNCMVSSASVVQGAAADSLTPWKARKMISSFADRSIIPKMLGSPENLAFLALSLNNFNDVKYIIETFNLQKNTNLNRELSFVEQQQQVQQKLAAIYANYQQQGENHSIQPNHNSDNRSSSKKPKATVDQIKKVAARGFEVSRIISVIDHFAHSQKIQQTTEQKQLLLKHSNNTQYAFLNQFAENNLNAVIITDLILNLPLNHEIVSNILNVIKRQQQISSGITSNFKVDPATATKSQMPQDMGAISLLENLCECLRLLEHKTLRDLLCDNYYSLKPHKLASELHREKAFQAVFYKTASEIASCSDLRAHASLFRNLHSQSNYYGRFSTYVGHLAQLLQLRDRNLGYHTSALLKIDPCDVIGELIFECDMTPLEIEANVAALNLNIVHVIALNICPAIAGIAKINRSTRSATKQKQETILNYISNQNHLLAYLLRGIITMPQTEPFAEIDINSLYFERFLQLPEIQKLAITLYDGNRFIAALLSDNLNVNVLQRLDSKLDQLKLLMLQMGNEEHKHSQATRIDELITELIDEDPKHINLATHIRDISLRAQLIQDNFTKIATTRLAKELIESTLQHKEATTKIPQELRVQLEHTLADITVYAKVSEVLQFETWPQAYDFGLKTPNAIFEKLLQLHLYKLCYKWCKVVKLSERFVQYKHLFLTAFLNALLELSDEDGAAEKVNTYLLQILETFSIEDCVVFLSAYKDKLHSVVLLRYAIDFLLKNAPDFTADNYRNYEISLVIFEQLKPSERIHFWKLLKFPLLIIEQLIMNAKFDTLNKVLNAVRGALPQPHEYETAQMCAFCFDKRGNVYDIHARSSSSNSAHKVHFQLGADTVNSKNSAFILLNFNLYQKDHYITNECIDLLLRIYGTKALDYHISDSTNSSTERISQTTDMQLSLDSLCGAFQMPVVAPMRESWVRDEDATHCMCCRRAAFTMLIRRHHCRRCGRVVCFACSTHRMRIPELYVEVDVRICNDCFRTTEEILQKSARESSAEVEHVVIKSGTHSRELADAFKWSLSGNITHDKLVREEFCYEHAPSVALCLSILGYHLGQQKCVDFLMYHCRKLEKLIVPNPEVDFDLVAKMMNCLALAAKVRGGPAEIESIREHSDIIMSVVQNGCESLIPPGPLNNHSLRKLGDSLVQAEKWQLALEVHLKCGFPTAGVMAAHGLSCLRAGCFDTAREKISYCMPKLSNELTNSRIFKFVISAASVAAATAVVDINENSSSANDTLMNQEHDIPNIKRPQRGPPLLQEILKIIESTPCSKPQPETLHRASIIRNSNTSLTSLLSRRKDPFTVRKLHEPALNVLTTLANLKRVAKGHYGDTNNERLDQQHNQQQHSRQTHRHLRAFEECIHYVLTYGSHTDVLQYLMRHQEIIAALKYFLIQNLDADLFIHNIFLVLLHYGQMPALITQMQETDLQGGLLIWRHTLLQTCRYLEAQNLLNSLYQLQVLLKDPVRASMTCVKFYTLNCANFQQLHANAQHLQNAHQHLQSELEITKWENFNSEPTSLSMFRRKSSSTSNRRRSSAVATSPAGLGAGFIMQMDARSLNSHINTILRQLDVAKFLAKSEKEQPASTAADELITLRILKQIRLETGKTTLPTLFDTAQERIQICILILLCGKNIEEGFGLTYRIIQDYKLPPMKIYAATAKYLARNQRLPDVEKLLDCITSNNGINTSDIDDILSIAIHSAINNHEPEVKNTLDNLLKKINSIEMRISCHIFIGQLKSAYLLASKCERLTDIRKILRQAELTNQIHIKKLCEKKLSIQAAAGRQ